MKATKLIKELEFIMSLCGNKNIQIRLSDGHGGFVTTSDFRIGYDEESKTLLFEDKPKD